MAQLDPMLSQRFDSPHLRDLVISCKAIPGSTTVEQANTLFEDYKYPYIAVLDKQEAIGLCARERIQQLLASSFEKALYAKNPIRLHMLSHPLIFQANTPIREVFEKCFNRDSQYFSQDILVVEEDNHLVGLVPIEKIIKAQHQEFQEQTKQLSHSQTIVQEQAQHLSKLGKDLEEKKAELSASQHNADEGSKIKTEILTNMSHEIRTPMNGIIGMLALLKESGLNGEQEHFASAVQNSALSLLDIINDLLDLSNIEAGKLDIEEEEIPIWEFLEDCTKMITEIDPEKNIAFMIEIEPAVPEWIMLDGVRYRQIISKLLNNALKFTEQGEVTIRLSTYHCNQRGAFFRTEIIDTGIGFDETEKESLFEAFSQADGSIRRRFGGTGLGLAISNKLASLMEGQLDCKSTPQKGSNFWVDLPLKLGSQKPRPILKAARAAGLKALVIEDHPALSRHICQQLELRGIKPIGCHFPEHARKLLHVHADNQPFNLIVADLDTTNQELLRELNEDIIGRELKFIELSSKSRSGTPHSNSRTLPKPVCPTELNRALISLFPKNDFEDDEPTNASISDTVELSTMNVLLVDDSHSNCEIAARMLKKLKQNVVVARSGIKALEHLREHTFDCVLMDCQMPEMDGYATTRSIREGFHGIVQKDIHIIALTAHSLKGDKRRCLEAGMNDYISKPFKTDALFQALLRFQSGNNTTAEP